MTNDEHHQLEAQLSMNDLPDGWMWTTLGDICSPPQYGWTTSAASEGDLHLLRTTDITSGEINWSSVPYCEKSPPNPEKYLLRDGDIVISRAGSVGYSYLLRNPKNAVFASYLIRFTPKQVLKEYIAYFLNSPAYWQAISESKLGIAVQNVNASKLKQIRVPLAPLAEQKRIVDAIETQFTRLDAAVASLRRAQARLKRYKTSLLKAACEGRLVPTEAELARAEERPFEDGATLLGRILAERLRQWEADNRPPQPKDNKWKEKYREPAAPDVSSLPELPEGWVWATVEQVGKVQLGRQRAPQHHNGLHMRPYLRVANVFEDRIDTSDVMEMNFSPGEYEKFKLEYGDILLNEGQSPEFLGRPAMYRDEVPGACFQNTLIRFKASSNLIPKFALMMFRSYMHNGRFQQESQITTNIAHLSAGRFAKIEFPLPPLAEQQRIVEEVERRLSVIDQQEAVIAANLRRAARLRQSILKRAFAGQL